MACRSGIAPVGVLGIVAIGVGEAPAIRGDMACCPRMPSQGRIRFEARNADSRRAQSRSRLEAAMILSGIR